MDSTHREQIKTVMMGHLCRPFDEVFESADSTEQ